MDNLTGKVVVFSNEPTSAYYVIEDNGDRVYVRLLDSGLNFEPTCTVSKQWISIISE